VTRRSCSSAVSITTWIPGALEICARRIDAVQERHHDVEHGDVRLMLTRQLDAALPSTPRPPPRGPAARAGRARPAQHYRIIASTTVATSFLRPARSSIRSDTPCVKRAASRDTGSTPSGRELSLRSRMSPYLAPFQVALRLRSPVHKQLWWRVHEPEAPELSPTPGQQNLLAKGASGRAGSGTSPGRADRSPVYQYDNKVTATRRP